MKQKQLKRVLDQMDIDECEEVVVNHIFYCEKAIRQRCFRGDGSYSYRTDRNEFLVIAKNGEKQGIILRCGEMDFLRLWR